MSFSALFKKASNLLGLNSDEDDRELPTDGEIVYCKNNVCVHPPATLRSTVEHHPGYLMIKSQDDQVLGSTLILSWIPNTTLRKNPRSIENSPSRNSPRASPRHHKSPRSAEFSRPYYYSSQSPTESTASTISDKIDSSAKNDTLTKGRTRYISSSYEDTSSPDSLHTSPEDGKFSDISTQKLSSSIKSQTDSGIVIDPNYGSAKSSNGSLNYQRLNDTGSSIQNGQGEPLQSKLRNISKGDSMECSSSSDTDSPSTGAKLKTLVKNNQVETTRERTSSNRSQVSIEMEGDNLVITTEELEGDDPFVMDMKDQGNTDTECASLSSDSTYPSPTGEHYKSMLKELQHPAITNNHKIPESNVKPDDNISYSTSSSTINNISPSTKNDLIHTPKNDIKSTLDLPLQNITLSSSTEPLITPDIAVTQETPSTPPYSPSGSSSGDTSGPDSHPSSPYSSSSTTPSTPSYGGNPYMQGNPEAFAVTHNLTFPESTTPSFNKIGSPKRSPREQVCGIFSVDLGQMRSVRLFYNNEGRKRDKCGQLVLASCESQYKILHFHHGGLSKLAEVLQGLKFIAEPNHSKKYLDLNCTTFSIVRPQFTEDQCHPEEGVFNMVTGESWMQHMNPQGQIEEDYQLKKAIFFGGIEPSLRHEAWPFLLHYYPFESTYEEREQIRNDRYIEYQNIRKQREMMTEDERERFWRSTQCTVEKDVVRTDRSHPYFRGEDNPNIEVLKNILLNYATAHPVMGYTQGMSDLLAPVLAELQNEVDAYWCFVGLMLGTIFISSPKDMDMDKQLNYLRELLRLMQPKFYEHLLGLQDAMELLFCHRWVLLCFKREFPERDALKMWEACWAHYQTDYFHLFICVAIIAVYGEDVVQENLPSDEMLLHFSSLSMHMNGEVVLRKARGLLHQFRTLPSIPCTLDGLCTLCGPGMWDSGHVPTVKCTKNHKDGLCPYGGNEETSS
ncbi:unnamed protein product [Owenia fusiformis]|uniref:Uncharacterized protein n=1 Tax=Owenia fusiformis TaxID=6347 RepID=A0A8J1XYX9_OWEFU|nr:unnamed protein product [Owenia fusiformis]